MMASPINSKVTVNSADVATSSLKVVCTNSKMYGKYLRELIYVPLPSSFIENSRDSLGNGSECGGWMGEDTPGL